MSENEKIENYVPINWLLFQLEIRLTKKNCISRQQCIEIASECYIQEKDVNDVLMYFHQLGILLHYRNVPALENVIFCNPQWLFDRLTKLIEWKYKPTHQLKKSIKNGIFDKKDIVEVLSKDFDGNGVLKFKQLLHLFVSLNIMALLPGDNNRYFMPALLNPAPPDIDKNLFKCYGNKVHDTLIVKFENRYFPRGVVCCLVAEFMNNSGWNIQHNEAVYKDLIIFEVSEKQYIFIRDKIDSIAVEMYCHGDDHCKTSPLVICEKLSMTLTAVCKKIKISSDFKFGFSCTYSHSDGVLCNGFSGVKDSLPYKGESLCEKCHRRSSLKSEQAIWIFEPPKELPNVLTSKVAMQSQPSGQQDVSLSEPIDLMMVLKLQRDLFTDNLHFIVENLNPSDIINQLISEHLVGQSAREQLKMPQKTNIDKNNIIVDELSRGQPGTVETFLHILRSTRGSTNFMTIADKLEKGWSFNTPNEDSSVDSSSISRILNTEPKMGDLRCIVISKIKEYWEYTAYALEFGIDDVEAIKVKYQEDSNKCCWEMFKSWLNATNPCGIKPKTWSVLLSRLKKVEEITTIVAEIKSDVIKLEL